jgi:MFS family permease
MGFSLFGLVWGIGMIVGPMLGGFLSNPVQQYPNFFGWNVFLEEFPYFLPCACSAAFSCFGFALGYFYLEETCKHITKRNGDYISVTTDEEVILDRGESSNTLLVDEGTDGNLIETSSIWMICGYASLSFFNTMFDEVFSVWMVTPLIYGGLSYTSKDVGLILSIMGLIILYCQLYLYQKLSSKISRIRLYQSVFPMYMILFYLVFPLISSKLIYVNEQMSWVVLVIAVAVRFFANVLGFTSITILLNNSAEKRQLGFVNGCCQTGASFVRAIGPALGGIIWSYSLRSTLPPPFDNRFIWLLLGTLALMSWIHSFFIPDISETSKRNDSDGADDLNFMIM